MRVSIYPNDAGYRTYIRARRNRRQVVVLVNGQKVGLITTADEEQSKAWGFAPNKNGRPYLDPGDRTRAKTIEYSGKVAIRLVRV